MEITTNGITSRTITVTVSSWKFCPHCGKQLEQGWNHCPQCGSAIGAIHYSPYIIPYYPSYPCVPTAPFIPVWPDGTWISYTANITHT